MVKKKSWRQKVIDNKPYINPPSARWPELSGKRVRLVPNMRKKIIAKVVADAEALEDRHNALRDQAKQARIDAGERTKAAIKVIMERHPTDAKPRDIWPDIEAEHEMKIGKAHAYEVMREIRKEQSK